MYVSMTAGQPKRDKMVSVRLNDEELERLESVVNTVLGRERYAKKADVLRELLGVMDTGMVLLTDRERLSTGGLSPSVVVHEADLGYVHEKERNEQGGP